MAQLLLNRYMYMKTNEMLNQIKTLLSMEIKLEEQKLENGTVLTAESFEKDKEVFIVSDDEKIALPVGEYEMEDGKILVVEEEGIIANVTEVEAKEETEEETEEVEAEEDITEETKEELGYATKEELGKVIDMIEEIKAMINDKEEMSGESTLKSRTVKEEFSETENVELSEPSAKPIKHNPETETVTRKMEFAKGNFGSTALDRVLN